jgi:hypothetical protein
MKISDKDSQPIIPSNTLCQSWIMLSTLKKGSEVLNISENFRQKKLKKKTKYYYTEGQRWKTLKNIFHSPLPIFYE